MIAVPVRWIALLIVGMVSSVGFAEAVPGSMAAASEDTTLGPGTVFPPAPGVLATFELNGNARDSSGNGRDGVLLGGRFVRTGFGRGLHVYLEAEDGVRPMGVDWSSYAPLLTHPYTIEIVMTPETTDCWQKIFGWRDDDDRGWYYCGGGFIDWPYDFVGARRFPPRQRHYLAIVSTSPGSVDVFFQGEFVGSTATTFTAPPPQAIFFRDDTQTSRFEQLDAVVDAFRISGTTRTPSELAAVQERLAAVPDPTAFPGLSDFERSLVAAHDAENAFRLAEYLSTPNDGWAEAIGRVGKVTGSEAERAVAEFAAGKLRDYGVEDVAIRDYPTMTWDPHDFEIRVVAPGDQAIIASGYGLCYGATGTVDSYAYEALTSRGWGDPSRFSRLASGDYAYSFAAPETDTIVGELVWVGLGTAAAYERAGDVRGKIVLILRNDLVTGWPTIPLFEAANRGAAAVIFFGQHGENQHPDGVRGDVVCPGPIPTFQTSVNGAHYLQGLLASGPVVVSLRGRADIRSEAVARSVYVEGYIYGSVWPEQTVALNSQIDSWYYSASDGVSGLATTLEIARLYGHLKAEGVRPARTIAFLLVGSEEMGTTITSWFNWLGGSYAFVRRNPGFGARLVAALDLDVIGFPACCGTGIHASWELQGLLADTILDLGLEWRAWLSEGLTIGSDMWLYSAVAGGSALYCCDEGGFGEVYHNQFDTFDRQDFGQYDFLGRLFAVVVHRLANGFVVPLDLEALFRWMEGELWTLERLIVWESPLWQEYEDALQPAIEAVEEGIRALEEAWKRLVVEASGLRARYESAKSAHARRALEGRIFEVNAAILEARVHIINWAITTYELFRGLPYAGDFRAIQWALLYLRAGDPWLAAFALTEGWTDMWWGHLVSHETYVQLETWGASDMQWGGEHGQTPTVVDVRGEFDRLRRGEVEGVEASLVEKRAQLLALLEADLYGLSEHLAIAQGILVGG